MNPEDIGRVLDEIGERIGPAGEYAFGLAVRQQITLGIIWTAFWLAVLVISLLVLRSAVRGTEVIKGLVASFNDQQDELDKVKREAQAFRDAKEQAAVDAMIPEQRKEWFRLMHERLGLFGGFYGSTRGESKAERTMEERFPFYAVAVVSGLIAAFAAINFVNVLPSLLNPEWRAIESLIGWVR